MGSTVREVALQIIRKRYPNFKPRNDYEIVALSGSRYRGPESEIPAWLDGEYARQVAVMGSAEHAIEISEAMLSSREIITGLKLSPGTPNVFVRPILHSSYSIRLFPGSLSSQEFCMDFVDTSTGRPVNSPFAFELLQVSDPGGTPLPGARIRSIERDISRGEEKFVLRDGMTCILRRPGRRDVEFTVPIRPTPPPSRRDDVDYLDFPTTIN
ncbi:hypothetical protein C8Q80DRAFT_1217221 [Daedaleopsis nitida]|nr:hypothetical protein C8Q80DRAFT_1217221 [Daedaleopsis nitida]